MLTVAHYYKLKYFNQTRLHNATTRIQSVFEPITNFCDNLQKRLPFLHKPFISDMSKIIDKEVYVEMSGIPFTVYTLKSNGDLWWNAAIFNGERMEFRIEIQGILKKIK